MTTVSLPRYSFGSAINHALAQKANPHRLGQVYTGPSPFDVPELVKVVIERPDRLAFEFNYADQDRAELEDRSAVKDGSIAVRLGEKSKRVLLIRFSSDIDSFLRGVSAIDDHLIVQHGHQLTAQETNSLRENVVVIKSILAEMPSEFLETVRTAVRNVARISVK